MAKTRKLNIIFYLLIALMLPIGIFAMKDRKYNIVSTIIAILAMMPFFVACFTKKIGIKELLVISIMISFSVLGRFIFAPIPHFKPIIAIVIITAIGLGPEAGFLTGAMTALLSNIYFGQGPWTPFQMVAWGSIGLAIGIIHFFNKKCPWWILPIYGVVGGFWFSMIMDIWSVLNWGSDFTWGHYGTLFVSALPVTAMYVGSNIVFLLLLTKPMLKQFERMKNKYGIFQNFAHYKKAIPKPKESHLFYIKEVRVIRK